MIYCMAQNQTSQACDSVFCISHINGVNKSICTNTMNFIVIKIHAMLQ